jgi:hypothetical protein
VRILRSTSQRSSGESPEWSVAASATELCSSESTWSFIKEIRGETITVRLSCIRAGIW